MRIFFFFSTWVNFLESIKSQSREAVKLSRIQQETIKNSIADFNSVDSAFSLATSDRHKTHKYANHTYAYIIIAHKQRR